MLAWLVLNQHSGLTITTVAGNAVVGRDFTDDVAAPWARLATFAVDLAKVPHFHMDVRCHALPEGTAAQ